MARDGGWEFRGAPLEVRFMAKVQVDASGCWLWTSALTHNGYGAISVDGRPVRAHRLAYELFVGEIPEGKQVHHHCDVRLCVNPAHLWVGTQRENIRDMLDKGRGAVQRPENSERVRRQCRGERGRFTKEKLHG